MFPTKLEQDQRKNYWLEKEFFSSQPFHFIHAYSHDNYKRKMHAHQFYEMNVIIRGSGRHYVEDMSLPATVGDVFVIPPEVRHGYYSKERIDVFHILIGSAFFNKYKDELENSSGFKILFDAEPHLRRHTGKNSNLHLNPTDFNSVKNDLELILSAQNNGRLALRSALTLSLILKLSGVLMDTVKDGTTNYDCAEILKVMDYVNSNLDTKLSLDTLADFMGISKATLNRKFISSIGVSPLKYVADCRTLKAKELLSLGKYNRTEIAQICGFFDVSHMNKYLKV